MNNKEIKIEFSEYALINFVIRIFYFEIKENCPLLRGISQFLKKLRKSN